MTEIGECTAVEGQGRDVVVNVDGWVMAKCDGDQVK
jgi:hypothetical protein